jgi:hypothetical protein
LDISVTRRCNTDQTFLQKRFGTSVLVLGGYYMHRSLFEDRYLVLPVLVVGCCCTCKWGFRAIFKYTRNLMSNIFIYVYLYIFIYLFSFIPAKLGFENSFQLVVYKIGGKRSIEVHLMAMAANMLVIVTALVCFNINQK